MQKPWSIFVLLLLLSAGACANSLVNAGFEQGTEQWQIWKGGIQLDNSIVHSGNAALRLDFSEAQAATGFGVWQTIVLDQAVAAPVTVGIWGKANAVKTNSTQRGRDGSWCRLSVSAIDNQNRPIVNWDSRRELMHFYFESDFDWTYQERTLVFREPIKSLTVFIQGRDCSGQAWFDDLMVLDHAKDLKSSQPDFEPCQMEEFAGQIRMENQFLKLLIDPTKGGRIYSCIDKATGADFTTTRTNGGLAKDIVKEAGFNSFFAESYVLETKESTGEKVSVTLRASSKKLEYFHLLKTYTLRRDSSELSIDCELVNTPEAMTVRHFTYRHHNELKVPGEKTRYLFPTSKGSMELMEGGGMQAWQNDIVQGWAALLGSNSGNGLLCRVDYPALDCFYNWFGEETNLEWFYKTVRVEAGDSWKTRVNIMPLHNAGMIAAAGRGLAVEFAVTQQPPAAGEALDFAVKIHSAGKLSAEVVVKALSLASGDAVVLHRYPLTVAPGQSQRYDCPWQRPFSGTTLLTCAIYNKNNELLLEARHLLTLGEKTADYVFPPEAEKLPNIGNLPKAVSMSSDISTSHIPWARPLPGEPVKILGLIDSFNARELAELKQRIDIEYTPVIFCQGFALPDFYMQYSREDSNVWLKEMLQRDYDLILIGGIPWNHIDAENRKSILEKMQSGCSLIYVYPVGVDENLGALLPVKTPSENFNSVSGAWMKHQPHFITDNIPFEIFPTASGFRYTAEEPLLSCAGFALAAARQLPQSRIVALTYPVGFPGSQTGRPWWRGGGLTPTATTYNMDGSGHPNFPYHEYHYALLARAILWCTRRESKLSIAAISPEGETELAGKLPEYQGLRLEWELRDNAFAILGNGSLAISGPEKVPLHIPDFAGEAMLHLRLIQKDSVLDFAAGRLSRPAALQLHGVNTRIHSSGTDVVLEGALKVSGKGQAELRLRDSWQRLVARQVIDVIDGENAFSVTFKNPLSRAFCLEIICSVSALRCGTLQKWCYLKNGRRSYDDYPVNLWLLDSAFLQIPVYLNELRMQRIAKTGIFDSVLLHNTGWRAIPKHIASASELLWRHNLEVSLNNLAPQHLGQDFFNSSKKQYQESKDKKFLCRQPCLHDPRTRTEDQERIRRMIDTIREYQPAHYGLGDENSLTMWGQSFDFCFSEFTLQAFRKWLSGRYVSLEHLNQVYQTNYQDFQEVIPLTSAEAAEQKNYASWLDHRAFMDLSMAEFYQQTREFIQQLDPGCPISISGTVPTPNPYSGYDWYLFLQAFQGNLLAPYSGIQTSLIRSFADDQFTAMPFNGGYDRKGTPLFHSVWLTAFEYKAGGNSFFIDNIALNADLTLSRQLEDYGAATRDLRHGLGMLLRNSRRDHDGVLVLYSQNSMRMATITEQSALFNNDIEGWRQLLDAAGCQYRFAASQELARLDPTEYKVLILPFAISLSAEEIAALENFLRKGGTILADYGLGIYDGHGRIPADDPAAELLGIRRKGGTILPGQLSFEDLQVRIQLQDDTVAATAAKVLGTMENHPAVFLREFDSGKIIHVNFLFDQFPSLKNSYQANALHQQLLLKLLRLAGLKPSPVQVTLDDGQAPHSTRIFRYKNGDLSYIGLLQEPNSEAKYSRLKVNLAHNWHVCNVRKSTYLGDLQQMELELSPGEAALFSLLPRQPAKPAVTLDQTSLPSGGEITGLIELPGVGNFPLGRQAIRLEVLDPSGYLCTPYCRNLLTENGQVRFRFSTALSDQPGQWQVRVIDLTSGLTSTAMLEIRRE